MQLSSKNFGNELLKSRIHLSLYAHKFVCVNYFLLSSLYQMSSYLVSYMSSYYHMSFLLHVLLCVCCLYISQLSHCC